MAAGLAIDPASLALGGSALYWPAGIEVRIGVSDSGANSAIFDRRGDVGLIRIDSGTTSSDVRPWIYVSGRGLTRRAPQYRIRSVGFTPTPPTSPTGRSVCMSGARTGGHCGRVIETAVDSQRWGSVSICRPGQADHVWGGDSGGPVVKAGQARGMMVSYPTEDTCLVYFFQSARLAEALTGVTISH